MSIPSCHAYHARNASGSCERKKTPPMPATRSATDALPRAANELGEDVTVRAELFEPRVLALRRVGLRNGEVGRGADLLCHRQYPLDQRLDPGASGHDLPTLEVD